MNDSSRREMGKVGMQQRNKDRLGANSGPMGVEDERKDKFGSTHNQDALGLRSEETQDVRNILKAVRKEFRRRKHRRGSR
jgi:hypothetical protein